MRSIGVLTMTKFFNDFLRDETGAAAAEYALILAIVGAGIAGAAIVLGGAISTAMNDAATCIGTPTSTC
jgi:pilus assembly protein Flp/PilA